MTKIKKLLSDLYYIEWVPELINTILYSFNNLPTSSLFTTPEHAEARCKKADSPNGQGGGDKMLRLWVELLAAKLPQIQAQTRYKDLISNHNICMALLQKGVLDCRSKPTFWEAQAARGRGDVVEDEDDLFIEEGEEEE